jgi:hypothetical protein
LTDTEEFDYEIAKPLQPGVKGEATITSIKEKKAVEVFRTKAREPEQVLFVIYGNVNGWEGRIGTINKPASRQISPRSRLAKFKQRYKQFPRIGMKIQVEANAAGYWSMMT